MNSKPTAGAMRAAQILTDEQQKFGYGIPTGPRLALFIDREAGIVDMLNVLVRVEDRLSQEVIEGRDAFLGILLDVRAAITKAEGKIQ